MYVCIYICMSGEHMYVIKLICILNVYTTAAVRIRVCSGDDPINTTICKGITRGVVSLSKTSVNVTKGYTYT